MIVADPLQFLKAGVHAMSEAAILTHLGRCGLVGARAADLMASLSINYNTATTCLDRLAEKKLVTRYARTNRQGRAFYWNVTTAGWELLTREPDLGAFPQQSKATA